MPYVPSIDILGFENLLSFPTSAIFSSPPADLIPFSEFQSKGIYVPLALTVDAHEIDGSGLATVDLGIDHDAPSLKHPRRKKDREVVKVEREEAWKLGMDEAWVEPEGTCRGDFSSEKTPWERVMRALTQFLASRSYSYGKAYISHDTEFRTITGLHHHQAFAPHMLSGASLPESDAEDVEASAFIRDMEGAMKGYWKTVMGNAHGRIHRITAKESFEITNAFLHYLEYYEILFTDVVLLEPLQKTLALSKQMLKQIHIAQHLSDALPGSTVCTSWHALALGAWVRAPADDKAWDVNGEKFEEKVEATFTPAREESLTRNLEEAEQAAREAKAAAEAQAEATAKAESESATATTSPDESGQKGETSPEQGEGEGYVYVDDGEDEIVVADWENAVDPDERLTHAQAIEKLAECLGVDVTTYTAHDSTPVKEYTISDLSPTRPSSVSGERLDARFIASASERAGDFLWLTLSTEKGKDVVLLVDGKRLNGKGMETEAAKGMRMSAQMVTVGEGKERTAMVGEVLEGIVPRF